MTRPKDLGPDDIERSGVGGSQLERSKAPRVNWTTRRATVLWGGVSAVLMLFPLAGACALLYRFPVPFVGYERGFEAVPSAVLAIVFYGLLGAFPVAFGLGAVAGVVAHRFGNADPRRIRDRTLLLTGLVACVIVVFLAILDKLIGPW